MIKKRAKEKRNSETKYIENLREQISNNQGDLLLIRREIVIDNAHYDSGVNYIREPSATYSGTLELGIINGELEKNKKPSLSHTALFGSRYFYSPDYTVSVKNKLSVSGISQCYFIIDQENIEKIEENSTLSIGNEEISKENNNIFENIPRNPPYLSKIEIIVGEEKINETLSKHDRFHSSLLISVRDEKGNESGHELLFTMLKGKSDLGGYISKLKKSRANSLSESLVYDVCSISLGLYEISKLPLSLENLSMDSWSPNGDSPDYFWNDNATVERYNTIITKILKHTLSVNKIITEENNKKLLTDNQKIDGKIIGFPSSIDAKEYLKNATDILNKANSVIGEINSSIQKKIKDSRRR